jgi:hypothetical protein
VFEGVIEAWGVVEREMFVLRRAFRRARRSASDGVGEAEVMVDRN